MDNKKYTATEVKIKVMEAMTKVLRDLEEKEDKILENYEEKELIKKEASLLKLKRQTEMQLLMAEIFERL